jgi:hypothetical protein
MSLLVKVKLSILVVVVVWEGRDATKALPGLHHGDEAYRQANSHTAPSTTLIYLVEASASWPTRLPNSWDPSGSFTSPMNFTTWPNIKAAKNTYFSSSYVMQM